MPTRAPAPAASAAGVVDARRRTAPTRAAGERKEEREEREKEGNNNTNNNNETVGWHSAQTRPARESMHAWCHGQRLPHQSQAVISSFEVVPRTAAGSAPPEMKALTRTPPCQFECFPPLSGKLLALPSGPPGRAVQTGRTPRSEVF